VTTPEPAGAPRPTVDVVVKLGGGALHHREHFDAALRAIDSAARERAVVLVPGGGVFADAVRAVDERIRLPDDAAHWMAVLAMDQLAHLVAARSRRARLVEDPGQSAVAIAAGALAVLAPFRWLRAADPLPHSWDVTSDSIAAWVAGELAAPRLVLIKPPGVTGDAALDPYFRHVPLPRTRHVVIAADQVDALGASLGDVV
jgi:aspartokinase-like uncharacterized kinase